VQREIAMMQSDRYGFDSEFQQEMTEVPLSKAHNPQMISRCQSKMTVHCSVSVCFLLTSQNVCALTWMERTNSVWVTICITMQILNR